MLGLPPFSFCDGTMNGTMTPEEGREGGAEGVSKQNGHGIEVPALFARKRKWVVTIEILYHPIPIIVGRAVSPDYLD